MAKTLTLVRFGSRHALRLLPLAAALWLVPQVVLLPSFVILDAAVGPGLSDLPPAGFAAGDFGLVLLEGVRPVLAPLFLSFVLAVVLLWQWNVVWQAGVVSWQLWIGGESVSLLRVVGLGFIWWWRYLRFSFSRLSTGALALFLLWFPLSTAMVSAFESMAEARMLWLLLGGLVGTALLWLLWWAAGLRGSWLLGRPDRRSAFLAFIHGLWASLRRPLSSFGVLLIWLVPLSLCRLLPLFVIRTDGLSTGLAGAVLLQLALLTAAWLRLGLFLSYAPTCGLLAEETEEPDSAVSAARRVSAAKGTGRTARPSAQ